jgi:predicted ester cyclase
MKLKNLHILMALIILFGCDKNATEEANKAVVMRAWEEGFNQGNMDILRELFDESYMELTPYDTIGQRGSERAVKAYEWMHSVFGDIHFEVEQMLAEGNYVFSRAMATGTHVGNFLGVPPTGRPVRFAAVVVSKISDGKHVQDWSFIDTRAILKQIDDSHVEKEQEERNKTIITRMIEEGINGQNFEIFDELLAPDYVRYSQAMPPGLEEITGIETYKRFIRDHFEAFPDYKEEILHILAEADKVSIITRGRATHTGPLGDIAATNKKLIIDNYGIFRLKNGKIMEMWVSWDNLAMQRQLGLELKNND